MLAAPPRESHLVALLTLAVLEGAVEVTRLVVLWLRGDRSAPGHQGPHKRGKSFCVFTTPRGGDGFQPLGFGGPTVPGFSHPQR
jgi:hypothetical protein